LFLSSLGAGIFWPEIVTVLAIVVDDCVAEIVAQQDSAREIEFGNFLLGRMQDQSVGQIQASLVGTV